MDFLSVLLDFILESLDLLLGWYFVEKISLRSIDSERNGFEIRSKRRFNSKIHIYLCSFKRRT